MIEILRYNSRFAWLRWPTWVMVEWPKCPPLQRVMLSSFSFIMEQGMQGIYAREIDNFFWRLEPYFESTGIENEAQKVSITSFSLKDIPLLWWHRRCDDVKRGSDPSSLGTGSQNNLRSNLPQGCGTGSKKGQAKVPPTQGGSYLGISEGVRRASL